MIQRGQQLDLQNSARVASGSGSGSSGSDYTGLTASQAWTAWNNDVETPAVIAALEHHYGQGEWSEADGGNNSDLLDDLGLTDWAEANYSTETVNKLSELVASLDGMSKGDALEVVNANRPDLVSNFSILGLQKLLRRYQ
jgi:hypothetical protein